MKKHQLPDENMSLLFYKGFHGTSLLNTEDCINLKPYLIMNWTGCQEGRRETPVIAIKVNNIDTNLRMIRILKLIA